MKLITAQLFHWRSQCHTVTANHISTIWHQCEHSELHDWTSHNVSYCVNYVGTPLPLNRHAPLSGFVEFSVNADLGGGTYKSKTMELTWKWQMCIKSGKLLFAHQSRPWTDYWWPTNHVSHHECNVSACCCDLLTVSQTSAFTHMVLCSLMSKILTEEFLGNHVFVTVLQAVLFFKLIKSESDNDRLNA